MGELGLSAALDFVDEHHVVHAGRHFSAARPGRQMRAADDHDPVSLLRAADTAGPIIRVFAELLDVLSRRGAKGRNAQYRHICRSVSSLVLTPIVGTKLRCWERANAVRPEWLATTTSLAFRS